MLCKKLKLKSILTLLLFGVLTSSAQAYYHYSGDKCDHSLPIYRGKGVCGDREIPEGRNRNARNIRLECSSNSDHHIRGPIAMPPELLKAWKPLEEKSRSTSNPEKRGELLTQMHEMRLKEAKIEWSGVIPYSTVENWTWTTCEEHQDSFRCGTHSEQSTCTKTVYHTRKDGTSYSETVTVSCTVQVANYCKYDTDEYESVPCSQEVMDYHAEFQKPGSDWQPPKTAQDLTREEKTPLHLRYNALIPNKYDLLPGELEDIQVFNNKSCSPTLNPDTEIGDAWNKYHYDISFEGRGGSSAACVYGKRYAINVKIITDGRDNTRSTPNAFKVPTHKDGSPDEAFEFFTAQYKGQQVNVKPEQIKLVDSSNGVLETMSKQIRATSAAIESAKAAAGQGKTGTVTDPKEATDQGFFKDTQLKIKVIEKNLVWGTSFLARDNRRTDNYHGSGALLTIDGNFWKIPLNESYSKLYKGSGPGPTNRFFNKFDVQLKPNTDYLFLVSMYQAGIPFYAQKGQQSNKWKEFFQGEDAYYSKPLVIPFHSSGFDERNLINRLADY